MKSVIAYYLLLIYVVALCKPVLPLVNDFLAHTFWQTDHIIAVHHDHGDEHVHYEVLDAAKESEDDNKSQIKLADPVSVHVTINKKYDFAYQAITKRSYPQYNNFFPFPVMDRQTPPPKV